MPLEPLTAERRRQQTREYLLQAAAQVFAERGFYAATLDEVAAAAGFTKGAVYSNFKNKEDLFLALLEDAYAREMTALRATIEGSDIPPEARIGDFVSLIAGEMDRVPNMGALYLEFHLYALRNPAARARMNELEQEDIRAIAEIIEVERGQRGIEVEEPAERTARIIVALFRGINLMRTANPEAAGEELLEAPIAFVTRAQGIEV
jgi:AcrR family transcriptional regulator